MSDALLGGSCSYLSANISFHPDSQEGSSVCPAHSGLYSALVFAEDLLHPPGPATEFIPSSGCVQTSSHDGVQSEQSDIKRCSSSQGLDVGALQGRLSLRCELKLTSQKMFFI